MNRTRAGDYTLIELSGRHYLMVLKDATTSYAGLHAYQGSLSSSGDVFHIEGSVEEALLTGETLTLLARPDIELGAKWDGCSNVTVSAFHSCDEEAFADFLIVLSEMRATANAVIDLMNDKERGTI